MSYKQYRADFAKLAWTALINNGAANDDGQHEPLTAQQNAEIAVSYADALIAELERTEQSAADRTEQFKADIVAKATANVVPIEHFTTPATRPLPPVLADEKEGQP